VVFGDARDGQIANCAGFCGFFILTLILCGRRITCVNRVRRLDRQAADKKRKFRMAARGDGKACQVILVNEEGA